VVNEEDSRQRRSQRGRREQLLTLINGWDPAGVLQSGGPRDSYEWLAAKLLPLLEENAGSDAVTAFLAREVDAHFHTAAPDAPQFAAKVVTWFRVLASEPE
jgi:hypothetical protein